VIRATTAEKEYQITMLEQLHKTWQPEAEQSLKMLRQRAIENQNIFDALMEVTKHASLGQITDALFKVGGQYRRNM